MQNSANSKSSPQIHTHGQMKSEDFPRTQTKDSTRLTAAEVAEHYGVKPSTILRWARNKQIPVSERVGQNFIRFDLDEVRKAMKNIARS